MAYPCNNCISKSCVLTCFMESIGNFLNSQKRKFIWSTNTYQSCTAGRANLELLTSKKYTRNYNRTSGPTLTGKRTPLLSDKFSKTPKVSKSLKFITFWVVAYKRFDCIFACTWLGAINMLFFSNYDYHAHF